MEKLSFSYYFAFLLLAGCASIQDTNKLSLGMSKQQVINVMGPPESTRAANGVEYMMYSLINGKSYQFLAHRDPYFVRIVNDKVDAFGKEGDFNSTMVPTHDVNITVKQH